MVGVNDEVKVKAIESYERFLAQVWTQDAMFLAVDMFTGYIQLAPISSRATPALIEAILETIIRPFGVPRYFRCDSETGMFSSTEFRAFMEPLVNQS